MVDDQAEARFRHPRPVAVEEGRLHERREHGLVVHELLDAMEHRLAPAAIELAELVLEEAVDVGIAPAAEPDRLGPGADPLPASPRDPARVHPDARLLA